MLKCQFHTHAAGDPIDNINYSPEELINRAAEFKYDILSITCHRKVIFSEELEKYAKEKNILLLPGIELEINKKHILGINIDKEIEQVDSFKKLKKYKKNHPQCLIIAPHPFFPTNKSLKTDLIENIDLFDAIEISFAYTLIINFNKKAEKTAKKFNKPLLAMSDCHILRYLDTGYALIEAQKEKAKIIHAIKKDKIKNITARTNLINIFLFFLQIAAQLFLAKLKK